MGHSLKLLVKDRVTAFKIPKTLRDKETQKRIGIYKREGGRAGRNFYKAAAWYANAK